MSRRTLLFALLGLIALGIVIERLVVTDREAIESLVDDAQAAFNEQRFEDLEGFLAEEFTYAGRDRAQTLAYLGTLARSYGRAGVVVVMDPPAIEGDQAQASARVRLRALNQFYEIPVSLRFVRSEDGWRLLAASRGAHP